MFKNDLTGKRFNRWTVLKYYPTDKKGTYWLCKCDCGTIKPVTGGNLKNGISKSCGCYEREKAIMDSTSHGMRYTRIYKIWQGMKYRCNNPHSPVYKYYGARGITVCDKWNKFIEFYEDMKIGYNDNLTLDRINNDGNYCKENCRWVNMQQQANNKRNNHIVVVDGETGTISNMARKYHIPIDTAKQRLRHGWNGEKALKTPILNPLDNLKYRKNSL